MKFAWVIADGVTVGKQVPVRSLTYNSINNTYEFVHDGDTSPTLVWTPAAFPESSSTWTPSEAPVPAPTDPGTTLSPTPHEWGDLSPYELEEIKHLILIFPKDSGVDPVYIVISQQAGDHKYHSKPDTLPAFPEAKQVRGKTRVQRGGYIRPRWVDKNGLIYEWDLRHGTIEKYNKRGVHLGEFNHNTGAQTKEADPSRRIEP